MCHTNRCRHAVAAAVVLQVAGAGAATASEILSPSEAPDTVEAAIVFARGESKIGVAKAASEGSVGGSDLLVRPLLRVAELLEAVPGMVAAQHSGSGKANQYFLRGFNLDHGSDFTTAIDDVPMNFRTHGHGQGYLDLNGLIPEVVEREDYRKGPYRADGGDFAMAGAANMITIDRIDRPWVSAEVGSYGWKRLATGGTIRDLAGGDLTLVGQTKVYDGPWQEGENLRHASGFAKYSRPTDLGLLDLSLQGYRGQWRPTEQIPERIVGSAICADVFCSPDPSARGVTTRLIGNARITSDAWWGNVYAQYYDWTMYSNPTYANADGSSAQIKQLDRRWVFGGRGERSWTVSPNLQITAGVEGRYDDIGKVGVQHTIERNFVESLGVYAVKESSAALYGEATWKPMKKLRLTGGLRGDRYDFDVEARDAEAAVLGQGRGDDAILSPKVAAAYAVNDRIELYANWGKGFHSNDVRGVVNATTPVPTLVKGTGSEVGARFEVGKATLTATLWKLNLDSELKFVGDSNAVEPSEASKRRGYEIVGFWRPLPWLAIDANWTASHARYANDDYIPNAFENAGQVGVSAVLDRWEASLRWRHLGPYPLIEDNSERDPGSNVVNLRGAWKGRNLDLYAEVLNVMDSRDRDIAYLYESYIPTFDTAGPVEGRLSRVVEPRTFRLGLKYKL
jgi:outer membrane receptor protein involved in Fe transport